MNEQVLYNKYFEKFKDFKDGVMGFLQRLKDPPNSLIEILRNRITDNFHLFEK